ncbi:MAG: hypothetical protein F4Z24_07380 [Nitrospira sp. SB0666_bin_27]|nr:hypothetical protein [Nitrospira sp. SB0666_bin_27]
MNRGAPPAETRVTLRRSGCRVLQFGTAVALVFLSVCQAQGLTGDERDVGAQRGSAAGHQTAGTFDRLAGEYRGTSDGDAFVVWVDVSPPVEEGQQAALLLFREQDRPRLEAYVKQIIANPADYYRPVCERTGSDERKGRLNDLYMVWDTQGGLILLHDFQEVRLPPDWEEIEGGDYPPYLRNQEYIVWQEQEYAIRRIRRSAGTGALQSVQLTQTGFFQNFFDNPVINVTRVDNATPAYKLLGSYLKAKFVAWQELDALFAPFQGDTTSPPGLSEAWALLRSNGGQMTRFRSKSDAGRFQKDAK